jgi:hypothetical protein
MLFGTVSGPAMTFAYALRPKARNRIVVGQSGGKTEREITDLTIVDAMPRGWPPGDIRFCSSEVRDRYLRSIGIAPKDVTAETNAVRSPEPEGARA